VEPWYLSEMRDGDDGDGRRILELEAIVQSIPDGVYVGDASGIRFANRPALDMLGYESLEELNRSVATLMDEVEARDATGQRLAVEDNVFVRALGGESACMDVHVRHRQTKQERIFRSSGAPVSAGGEIFGAIALNIDVTEQRKVERELRVQRSLAMLERDVLSLLGERAPLDRVLGSLTAGLEAVASPGMLASVLLIEGGQIRNVAAASLPAAWCAYIENAPIGPLAGSCGTAAFRGERVIVADIATDPLWADYRDEALRHGLRACWSQPITATDGQVLGTVALYYREARTPTEIDLAAIEGTARVARIVLERHRDDSARDRLVRELRDTLQHNEVLIGILGHDLRNPLSAVISGTQVALSRETDEDKRLTLERVESSGWRMSRMINQLLDLTRVRVGAGLPMTRSSIDLETVARGVASEVQVAFPDRRLVIDVAGDTRGEWDGDRLSQVLSNLLCNAMEHSEDSDVILQLKGDDAGLARIEVHNDGAIPADQLPWLFDPFRRGAAREGASQGLGLGLYISRQIVLAHGGEIAVRSVPISGTTFQVVLPRTTAAARVEPALT